MGLFVPAERRTSKVPGSGPVSEAKGSVASIVTTGALVVIGITPPVWARAEPASRAAATRRNAKLRVKLRVFIACPFIDFKYSCRTSVEQRTPQAVFAICTPSSYHKMILRSTIFLQLRFAQPHAPRRREPGIKVTATV